MMLRSLAGHIQFTRRALSIRDDKRALISLIDKALRVNWVWPARLDATMDAAFCFSCCKVEGRLKLPKEALQGRAFLIGKTRL